MKENKNIECDGLEIYSQSIQIELDALQGLQDFIDGTQDRFELDLNFGYYGENFVISRSVSGMLLVKTTVDYSDEYEDGLKEFTEKVTVEDFVEFLDERLYENEYAINGDGSVVKVKNILSSFAERLRSGYYSC